VCPSRSSATAPSAPPRQEPPAGIYRLFNFTITQNGLTSVKAVSTMFPDHCSQASVLAAIRHAAAGAAVFGQFVGPSGPACTGVQFDIRGVINANGDIATAFPNY
jgi:hypothetical protein